jgi:hypothetical protein
MRMSLSFVTTDTLYMLFVPSKHSEYECRSFYMCISIYTSLTLKQNI